MTWRTLLPQLIQDGRYSRQADLVYALAGHGFQINQGTLSRELNHLGIRKQGGVYRLPDSSRLQAPVHDFALTANGGLAVIKTDPAFASVVGQFVDNAGLDGVLGTIAGDDTVFVAVFDERAVEPLRALLGLRR